jgi:hypothetical protein
MTIEEIKWLIQALAKYSVGGLVAGGIVYLLIKNSLSGYLLEKGKNLASKEDISKITDLVEGVKHDYNVLIKEMEGKQQLRMAAVDQRLQAHQDAFTLWRKMRASPKEEEGAAIMECQKFWEENCLYLEPEVRQAFALAYTSFANRRQLVDAAAEAKFVIEAWRNVMDFPNVLFDAIKLPRFTEVEKKIVKDDSNPNEP